MEKKKALQARKATRVKKAKRENRAKRRKRKKRIQRYYRAGAYICAALFVGAFLFIGIYYGKQWRSEKAYSAMRQKDKPVTAAMIALEKGKEAAASARAAAEKIEEEKPRSDAPHLENTVDFEALWNTNPDIYAWIQIPGTLVDYPVLQHPTDDVWYLNHTVEGVKGLPGSIYSESVHPKDFSAAMTVLYGHNMRNDTMFGSLHDYEDPAKLEESPYIYIYLPERTLVYQIFAAVPFADVYLPDYCNYDEESEFLSFVEEVRSAPGNQNREVEVPYGSRLLTLSTCIGNAPSNRYLVEAVQIDEYER